MSHHRAARFTQRDYVASNRIGTRRNIIRHASDESRVVFSYEFRESWKSVTRRMSC